MTREYNEIITMFDLHLKGAVEYNISWNCLMAVVDKIMAIGFIEGVAELELDNQKALIAQYHIGTDIDTVWMAVVIFIKWHNKVNP